MYPQLKLEILNPTPIDVTPYLLHHSLDRGDVSQIGASGVDGIVSSLSFTLGNSGQYQCQWDSEAVVDSETVIDSENVFDSEDDACLLFAYLFQIEPSLARDSFSPRDTASKFNQPQPLLFPNREVVFYVDNIERWRGFIREIRPSRSQVEVVAYDPAKKLQDAYIYTSKVYGSEAGTPAEEVIQQIINDNVPSPPILYTPTSPSFLVTPYKVEYESVWDAVQKIASMIGWYLGYRYVNGEFRLVLMEPPRMKDTPDFSFDADEDIYTQDLAISDVDVRNVVKITFREGIIRKSITVQDNDSIAQFGVRPMEIEEADTSLIDTEAEALRLANAVLHDLSSLPATTNLRLPYTPELDTFSTVAVRNPLISSTVDFYAVESVRHDGTPDRLRTEVICSGKVIGGRSVWLQKETRKGRPAEPIRGTEIAVGEIDNDRINEETIEASKYKEIRNILPWTGECILDATHPYEFSFEIPDDTIRIQQIKFSATGERFRSYNQTTESANIDVATTAEGGEISTTSEESGVHKHTMEVVTLTTTTEASNIISTIEINDEDAGVTITDNGHSHSVSAIGGTTSGDHSHQVQVDGAAANASSGVVLSGGTHKHTGKITNHDYKHEHSYQVPAYTSSEGGAHSHNVMSPLHAHGLSIPAHNHEMTSGIYESTTPDAVILYWDNGTGYNELNKIALAVAPDETSPYTLATGLDLTSKFTGKGYKRIKLVSSRQGRILFQILAKLDIVAR